MRFIVSGLGPHGTTFRAGRGWPNTGTEVEILPVTVREGEDGWSVVDHDGKKLAGPFVAPQLAESWNPPRTADDKGPLVISSFTWEKLKADTKLIRIVPAGDIFDMAGAKEENGALKARIAELEAKLAQVEGGAKQKEPATEEARVGKGKATK